MSPSTGRDATYSATATGLTLALVAPLLYALVIGPVLLQPRMTPTGYALTGFAVHWALALGLLALTRWGEGRSLVSLGIERLTWRMAALAVGLGVLLSLTVPLLTVLISQIIPAPESGGIVDTASGYTPGILLLSVLTAGITEEILFRGYAIERLIELTRRPWISALISLGVFVLTHLAGWNLAHVVGVVLPLGTILTALYMWRRNLVFVIIAHIMVDLPLVFIALGT